MACVLLSIAEDISLLLFLTAFLFYCQTGDKKKEKKN